MIECARRFIAVAGLYCLAIALSPDAWAEPGVSYSPAVRAPSPKQLFWGDTHLHTNLSPDAAAGGNRSFDHDAAYRVARGDAVRAHNGMHVRLARPLDFLVAADHAEYMGLFPGLEAANPELLSTPTGRKWHAMLNAGPEQAAELLVEFGNALRERQDLISSPEYQRSVWSEVVGKAEEYNDPGRFTALIGYEWSSGRGGGNMHRIVIFADGAERASQIVPFSSFDGDRPRELWAFLANYETQTGGRALAIPHNGNTSAGLMFAPADSDGEPMTGEYAALRARWEPLVEVTQYKGDSETHPAVSPDDAFADYESWDEFAGFSTRPHEDWMFANEYARPALRRGLAIGAELGVNPFRFGMIGSTDSHTGIASAEEDNFWGKFTWHEPSATRAMERFVNIPNITQMEWQMAASGLAAVWAEENTRDAIFSALRRKESYATTGPRMAVRTFGGWQFETADLTRPDWAAYAASHGVPMGGTLTPRPGDASPSFVISAMKDPTGANLDRVQVIKGWLAADGTTRERVHNVAWSKPRRIGEDGALGVVGNSVDREKARYRNDIGAASLATVWTDPDFDPATPAFYYVRVLEIPTPRWTAYDAAFFGVEMPEEVPMETQERAYTSPIWYVPDDASR